MENALQSDDRPLRSATFARGFGINLSEGRCVAVSQGVDDLGKEAYKISFLNQQVKTVVFLTREALEALEILISCIKKDINQ